MKSRAFSFCELKQTAMRENSGGNRLSNGERIKCKRFSFCKRLIIAGVKYFRYITMQTAFEVLLSENFPKFLLRYKLNIFI